MNHIRTDTGDTTFGPSIRPEGVDTNIDLNLFSMGNVSSFVQTFLRLAIANVPSAANDAGASSAGVPIGGIYRNGSTHADGHRRAHEAQIRKAEARAKFYEDLRGNSRSWVCGR